MTTRTIEITIQPDGQTTVQTHGFAGASCLDASRFIETTLGSRASERLTPDYHRTETIDQTTQQSD